MVRFMIGNVLTGRRIQTVPVLSGSWSDVLNMEGELQCTVTLNDAAVARLGLAQSATPNKAFLAAVDGDAILQAGPIRRHSFDGNTNHLTIFAGGIWEWLNDQEILPFTALNPSDALTDTRFSAPVVDPNAAGYPWPTDTRKSYQGMAVTYLTQVAAWPFGNVPINIPTEIIGSNEKWEKGSNLASVGSRLMELTNLMGGPDIRFPARFTTDRLGIQWDALIGTPLQPQIFSPQDVTFTVGNAGSSVSNFSYTVDGRSMATRAYATGGRGTDKVLIGVGSDSTLTDAGYPRKVTVDSSHSTVVEQTTVDFYAQEAAKRGRMPLASMSFDHDLTQRPFLGSFNVGDFASVKIRNNPYLPDGTVRMRITSRSGDAVGSKVHLELQPVTS